MRKHKHRLLALLIFLLYVLSSASQALAHIPCMCGNPKDQCTCFIQLGDKGLPVENIIKVLQKKGYLGKVGRKNEFTADVREAVIRFQAEKGLECNGWMDDETLDALLFDELPDASVKYEVEQWTDIVFVPTDGGIRYHTNPACSGMYHPRMITRVNAEKLLIHQCGKSSCSSHSSEYNVLMYSSMDLSRDLPDEYYLVESSSQTAAVSDSSAVRSLHTDDTESVYIGNKNSHVFHLSTCTYVNKMSDKNKVEFNSKEEALAAGYEPCSKCNP